MRNKAYLKALLISIIVLIVIAIPIMLFKNPFSGKRMPKEFREVSTGEHVSLNGVVKGFLRYKGVHSRVTVVGLATDTGSAIPNEDFRLYIVANKDGVTEFPSELFSTGTTTRRGFRCEAEGDILKLFLTTGLDRIDVSKKPLIVIDLDQLIRENSNYY